VKDGQVLRLRIVKYRGSHHGTNEYPFLIDEDGFSVLPITAVGLDHDVSNEIVSTGVSSIDEMLGPEGIYRGSSVLVSGTAGTGKTSLSASFLDAACRRGERCLLFAYEESAAQIVRNMRSIGIDLQRWIDQGLLCIHASRPSSHGLETHLVVMHKLVRELRPLTVVIDPISSLLTAGTPSETRSMMVRLLDFLKTHGVTALCTSLATPTNTAETSEVGVSSLIDTWLYLRQTEESGERNRTILVLKSRGMSHSNQMRELLLLDHGIELREAYLGRDGVLTGSARLAQEARDRDEELRRVEENQREADALLAKRQLLEAHVTALEAEMSAVSRDLERVSSTETRRRRLTTEDREAMARSRWAQDEAARSPEERGRP
jgi:circadian clock protein KaiC